MDRFAKTCLILIVLLLATIAVRPLIATQPVHASARYTQYDAYATYQSNVNQLPVVLTRAAEGGWDVIAVTAMPEFLDGKSAVLIILAK